MGAKSGSAAESLRAASQGRPGRTRARPVSRRADRPLLQGHPQWRLRTGTRHRLGLGFLRRFQLWEATPLEYLERLDLQNRLVPGLNRLEGLLDQGLDLAIVTSQPRFDLDPVTQPEIDEWFARLGFAKVTECGYYRAKDNLGIFDVIPCRPAGGFLQFIADTLAAGHTVRAVRTVTTTPRPA